jgi:glycosyltransferase involved in cell wall biosynthesis
MNEFVKMTPILHISNTDIAHDSRIRKEIRAIGELGDVEVSVAGVPENKNASPSEIEGAHYLKLRIYSNALRIIPRAIRYFFEMIEFTFKAVMEGRLMRPVVVHCHDTFALPAGLILKNMTGCKLVYDVHELESNKNAQNAILSFATLQIEKLCWNKVDLLVSVSDSITAWYMLNLGFKNSVLVLNSPAIAENTDVTVLESGQGRYFREKYKIPADQLVFVYLGILGTGRGIEICLDAFATGTTDAHVVFIGYGKLQHTIVNYADRYPNIHFHQAVPHDQVVHLVRNADYGLCLIENVSLSDFYCLPNKLFEYCFAGIPILASNFPEISRLVEQYSLGLCCDPNPNSVRAALNTIINRPHNRLSRDITSLSWEKQAERLKSSYRNQLMN